MFQKTWKSWWEIRFSGPDIDLSNFGTFFNKASAKYVGNTVKIITWIEAEKGGPGMARAGDGYLVRSG